MMILIESVVMLAAFVLLQIIGIDAFLIVMMWITFACIGLGLIGEFVITPWRNELRAREKSEARNVRNSISVATKSGRALRL